MLRRLVAGACIGLFCAGISAAGAAERDVGAKASRVPQPKVNIARGDKCVEPTDEMRRNHMKYILHQRDKTMHEGIRTTQHSLANCVECHADPNTKTVLGKDGFCASCHSYAAVSIDCFECHNPSPQQKAASNGLPVTEPRALDRSILEVSAKLPTTNTAPRSAP